MDGTHKWIVLKAPAIEFFLFQIDYAYQGFGYNELEIINLMTLFRKKKERKKERELIHACGCMTTRSLRSIQIQASLKMLGPIEMGRISIEIIASGMWRGLQHGGVMVIYFIVFLSLL